MSGLLHDNPYSTLIKWCHGYDFFCVLPRGFFNDFYVYFILILKLVTRIAFNEIMELVLLTTFDSMFLRKWECGHLSLVFWFVGEIGRIPASLEVLFEPSRGTCQ